jgi:hypothetical protein
MNHNDDELFGIYCEDGNGGDYYRCVEWQSGIDLETYDFEERNYGVDVPSSSNRMHWCSLWPDQEREINQGVQNLFVSQQSSPNV